MRTLVHYNNKSKNANYVIRAMWIPVDEQY